MLKNIIYFILLALLLPISAQAQVLKPVVKVSKAKLGNNYVYSYRVFNTTKYPISGVSIGRDSTRGALPELITPPLGMKSMLEPLPVTSYTVPSNWIFRMGGQEEVEAFVAEWEAPNQNDWIQPGAVQAGFSIRVPKDDATYINSHFTVYIQGKGSPSDLLVVEESPDLPPELTVLLSPNSLWPPNNKMVEITATISTKDDKDTNPVVKLLSITCNDGCDIGKDIAAKTGLDTRKFSVRASRLGKKKDGRQYTVTYTATDFGGNTTTKSAVVSIPHDQGNK